MSFYIKFKNPNHQLMNLFITALVLSGVVSCGKKSSVGTSESSSFVDTTGNIQPSNNYLWVHHKAVSGALRYTHKTVTSGTWPDQCKVDLDATSAADRDIMCITETAELDLMHMGMTLEYNVPAHVKCPYVVTMAPYFFQYEAPRNDGTATPPIEPASVFVDDNQVTGVWSATATYDDNTTPNNYFVAGSGEYRCAFDYRADLPVGPNCCQGYYNLQTKTTTNDGVSYTNARVDWGGQRGNCLAGPALSLNQRADDGFPIPIIWRMSEQVKSLSLQSNSLDVSMSPLDNFKLLEDKLVMLEDSKLNFGSFEINSLLEQKRGTSRFLANYTNGTTPRPYQDLIDYYGFDYPPGYNFLTNYMDPRYFTMLCVDAAEEVSARIRVQIREWNTLAELTAATEPTSNEDDLSGNETDFPGFPKHDYYDWEDTEALIRWNGVTSTVGYPGPRL